MKMKEHQVRLNFQALISNLYAIKNALEENHPVQAYAATERALNWAGKLRDEFVKK